MSDEPTSRRLAAIFAGDIAGYSRLMGVDEEGTLRHLKLHRKQLVDPKIVEHRGRIVKTTGDGIRSLDQTDGVSIHTGGQRSGRPRSCLHHVGRSFHKELEAPCA
jgi:class 3 adenylate cyclase